MSWKCVLKETALLLVIAVFAGAIANALRGDAYQLAWVGSYRSSASSTRIQPALPPQLNVPVVNAEPRPIAAEAASKQPEQAKPADVKTAKDNGSVFERTKENLRDIAPPKDPGLAFLEISGEIVLRMQKAGALFIDARRSSAYEGGHIPGARSIAVWEHDADAKVEALVKTGVPYDRVIVSYCSGADCKDAEMLAEKLYNNGFYKVYHYKAGFPDWEQRQWPVKQGREP